MVNFTIQALQANIKTAITEITHQTKEFAGRLWTYIQKFPVYAQDVRVAYGSLVVATLVAMQIAKLVTFILHKIVDNYLNETVSDVTHFFVGFGTVGALIWLFTQKAQLPLKREIIAAVVLTTIFARVVLFEKKVNNFNVELREK